MYTNTDCISDKITYIREFYSYDNSKPDIIISTEISAKN